MGPPRGAPDRDDDDPPLLDINTTPLIDVMLVLLVMLIITVPLQTHSITMSTASAPPPTVQPPAIDIGIDADGTVRWAGQPVADRADLETRLRDVAAQEPQPELNLHADGGARYEVIAGVLATAQRLGVSAIGIEETD